MKQESADALTQNDGEISEDDDEMRSVSLDLRQIKSDSMGNSVIYY